MLQRRIPVHSISSDQISVTLLHENPPSNEVRIRRIALWAVVSFSYVVASIICTRPLIMRATTELPLFMGDTALNAYILAWGQHALLTHPQSAFDASFMFPLEGSLCLSENMLGVALLGAPLAIFDNPLLTYNVMFMASGGLTALLWFAVLRRWGLGALAAWAGGLCFGFLPWRFSQLGHMQLLFTWWIPISLAAAETWIRAGSMRAAAALGFCLAASFYTCVYNFYFCAVFLVPFMLLAWVIGPRINSWRRFVSQLAVAIAVFSVCVLPAAPPYLSTIRMLNYPNSLDRIASLSASIGDYMRPSTLNYLWAGRLNLPPNPVSAAPWESELFLGFTAIVFAIGLLPFLWRVRLGVDSVSKSRARLALMLAGGAAAAFILSLGPWLHWRGARTPVVLPYRLLYEWLPGFDSIRVPSRAALFVGLSLSGLLALSLDQLLRSPPGRIGIARRSLAAGADFFLVLESLTHPLPVSDNVDYTRHLVAHKEIARRKPGPVLVLPIETELDYLVPLSSWPHFNPIVNGVTGHLPHSNGLLKESFGAREWTDTQVELLHWLGIRYIVVDHSKPDLFPPEAFENLTGLLEEGGFVVKANYMQDVQITLVEIEDTTSTERPVPAKTVSIDYNHTVNLARDPPEILLWLTNRRGPQLIPSKGRKLDVRIRSYDAGGEKLDTTESSVYLPPFWLRGQTVAVPIPYPRGKAERVASFQVRVKQDHLSERHTYRLRPSEAESRQD